MKADKVKKDSYHHKDLHEQIVAEAIKFLKNHSAEELSLRQIARNLGVSHMAPYRHFSNKEDLLAAIIEDGFKKLTKMFDEVNTSSSKDFKKVLAGMGKAYIKFFIGFPDQARLMFSGLLCNPEKHLAAHAAGQDAFARLFKLIEAGQQLGHFNKSDNPYMLSMMIWSNVHGAAMLMLENQFNMIDSAPEIQTDIFMDFMSDKLMKGLV
jgi:AcrR family transcriptional regulator